MPTASKVCTECGATVFADAPEGLCSVCLFRTGIASLDNKDDEAFEPTVARMLKDFGDYELLEEIGHGGQGVVYRARQKSLNRIVALKVIGLAHWATEAHVKRFRLEAEAAASLNHPCIVPIYEVGERDGACYFSMGLVEGGQLDAVAKREPIPLRHAAELIAKLARTVSYAHEHGILHRDIKPGNILLDAKGEPHLTDFGLARLVETESTVTRTMEVLGTPSYMAPEQAVGNNASVTSATDIYGLGAVLYQLLTGHPPFAGGTTFETVQLVLDTEPRQPRLWNPKIDRDLATICLKCLDKDPQRRYSSALALAEDLERWLKHEPIRARRTGLVTRGRKWVRRNPSIAVMAAMLLVLAVPLGVMIWKTESGRSTLSNPAPPEKSIAVLPFSNLSKEQENAFFADGVQDEILTDLARVADLKVISRTSVMPYKSGMARNLREIGRQLGVAHVVEGSVQRSGNRVRVNAQLVDARTDRHLWAQTYDRDLADVFAIQSEIAKTIADQLQAKLSPREENAIQRSPTSDISAFDLYARAKVLFEAPSSGTAEQLQAIDLLNGAVARDPSFFDAYCQLAFAHGWLYFLGVDHTSARLALAEAALQAASRLRPDAGETHLARGQNLYWGYRDYDGALAELEVARQSLPNDARIFRLTGYIQRRQGHWEESTRNFERAVELDPRDIELLQTGLAPNYCFCRRYPEAKSWYARVLAFEPNDALSKVFLGYLDFAWKADTRPLHQTIDSIRATNPAAVPSIAQWWLYCALAERDGTAAKDALIALGENAILFTHNVPLNRSFIEGVIARMIKDDEKARSAFTAARAEQEKIVQAQPNYGPALCVLGLIDAGLGRKDDALREGQRAVELLPMEKDAMEGGAMVEYLAMIAAWVGNKDLACEQLAVVMRRPSSLSYGQLKLQPFWDPLRGDPRFEKILEEAKQPVALEPITQSVPEKSIAVLPFENLSDDKQNAYFAEGVRDEILTDLAKIADLKVISHASVMHYKSGAARNLRQIGKELGVANVVEGSVQRAANRVRVNAQLVEARTDRHLWAQTYDRDLADVFAIQSEIAKTIAEQLQAKLTGQEEQVIATKPTDNPEAYDAYLRGLTYTRKAGNEHAHALGAQKYLREAVRLDPKFALGWALLSYVDAAGYRATTLQPTVALREEARQAAETALTLQPNLGEAVLAKGYYHYSCLRDYDTAVRYFEQARRLLPNSSRLLESLAYLERRRGQWDRSESYLNEAERLDPLNVGLFTSQAETYMLLRRFPEALRKLDQVLNITPDDVATIAEKVCIAQAEGDLPRAAALLAPLHSKADNLDVLVRQVYQAILERRPEQIIPRLKEILAKPDPALGFYNGELRFWLGWAQEGAGDHAAAQESWRQARSELESFLKEQPENSQLIGDLALTNMGLGDKAVAFNLIEGAMAANPIEKDALSGPESLEIFVRVAARMGEPDRATAALQKLLSIPGGFALSPLTPALLRLDPMFDPLRNDPRFQKLVATGIAVLPFENRSEDKANAYFADGIQDEILTRLSKIADLKVIARTSTQHYKSAPENLPEIAKQLGVAHILEGSVQKSGDAVRVNVQLIQAANGSYLWADTFDRKLTDIFWVESEVAKAIADQLQAKLTGQEEQVIAAKPTDNPEAYDAYLRGLAYTLKAGNTPADALAAQKYLREAVRLDPKFALGWALLSFVDASGYRSNSLPATIALREEARQAAETSITLQPDLGEALHANGYYHYSCLRDYDTAVRYFEQARRLLPNNSLILMSLAFLERRRGQWDRSESYFNQAEPLDPRNLHLLTQHAITYKHFRRVPEALRKLDQVLNITPGDVGTLALKAAIAQAEGDLPRAAALLAPLHPNANDIDALQTQVYQAILERRPAQIIPRLKEILAKPDPAFGYFNGELRFWLGWTQEVAGDHAAAQESWRQARSELESFLKEEPENPELREVLALTNMGLGDKAAALALSEQAMAASPIEKDALLGPQSLEILARVAAQMGEPDRAIAALQKLLSIPYGGPFPASPLTPALLRLDPMFDPLRNDPRFQKLVASPTPK